MRRTAIRPAIADHRLSLTSNGNVRYQLNTPCRDGTTHVIFEPLDFLARLAALVPHAGDPGEAWQGQSVRCEG